MVGKVKPAVPRGMRDILPETMIRRQYVVAIMQEVFELFGYEPLSTPAMELWDTLTGKYGPDAERLIYRVGHEGGKESLALRYDLSTPLSRVVAMYPDLQRPFRRYQISPVWRGERPGKGRYREFYQCDVDIVGSASMLADAEMLDITHEVLTRLGFQGFVMRINNRKILTGIGQFAGVPRELLGGLHRSIDKLEKIGLGGVKKELRDNQIPDDVIERLLELLQIGGDDRAILAELQERLAEYPIAVEGITELEEILRCMEDLNIPRQRYQVDFSMVRGLDYYTGPIYETVVEEPRIGSIVGGGRYDEMIGMFTGSSHPATGTSFGIERVVEVMEELDMFPPELGTTISQVLVTLFDEAQLTASLQVANELRKAGLNTELYFDNDPLGDQIRYALKKGIPYVVIAGPDELAAGQVSIRNLPLNEQRTVERGVMAESIKDWGASGEK
ncbi:MAG: histidine--tRNA ligase [Anaerolineae bacterium]|nr:histidine--tRNA ligase [Anaerolineae bacterium]NIN95637.1 histidine--tRNA ligase [Anaerolineae bacterium]NIQ78594.1 histidine--tRNA ligase [Anaerolineae bacterium]